MPQKNDKNIYVDIDKIINIFKKEKVEELTKEDWYDLKLFYSKISISSSFAHKFYKKSNE